MSGIFGRIIRYFVQDIVVKQLANSRTFQRFVLKIDTTLHKVFLLISSIYFLNYIIIIITLE